MKRVVNTPTVDYEYRPNVIVIGPLLSDLPLAPWLRELIGVLTSISHGKITVISRGFPSLIDNPKDGLKLIAIAQVPIYRGKSRLLILWNKVSKYMIAQALVSVKFLQMARSYETLIFQHSEPFLVALLARAMRKPSIYYVGGSGHKTMLAKGRNSPIRLLLLPWLKLPEVLMADQSSYLVAPSWRTVWEAGFEQHAKKIRICPPYVDLKAFEVLKPFVLRSLSVGYVGRLEEEKGFRQFIQAIPLIKVENPDIRFIVCGGGSLQTLLKPQTLGPTVEFLGLVPNAVVPRVMNELKILVVPSFTEGFGRVILEAMACGTPVLATKVEGVKALIIDGKTGFLIDTNDPRSIAKKVLSLISNPESLQLISVEARKFVEEKFTFGKMIDGWRQVLLEAHVRRQDK